jgi:hypothetical protein
MFPIVCSSLTTFRMPMTEALVKVSVTPGRGVLEESLSLPVMAPSCAAHGAAIITASHNGDSREGFHTLLRLRTVRCCRSPTLDAAGIVRLRDGAIVSFSGAGSETS